MSYHVAGSALQILVEPGLPLALGLVEFAGVAYPTSTPTATSTPD